MKKIKYRQYYHSGDYAIAELEVPDQCGIYEIAHSTSHLVRDLEGDVWTKTYILLCPTEFEDSVLIGNVYLNTIGDIFIIDSEIPVSDIEAAPRFHGVYSQRDGDPGSICMLRRLTATGIEVSIVNFKGWNGREMYDLSITELPYYGATLMREYSTDPHLAKLFSDESKRIYEYIINNE